MVCEQRGQIVKQDKGSKGKVKQDKGLRQEVTRTQAG